VLAHDVLYGSTKTNEVAARDFTNALGRGVAATTGKRY
jgi:hypothetical protein